MNFKKPREQVAKDAAEAAYSKISFNLQQIQHGSMSNMGYNIQTAICDGIREAILSMINDIYTDVEFEQDLKLRDKTV